MGTNRIEFNSSAGYVQIVAEGHMLPAFWAHPNIGGVFPGVVLIHDRWGLTPRIRRVAQRLAAAGYYVMAPDLFNRRLPGAQDEANRFVEALGEAGPPYVMAAAGALKTHHRCNCDLAAIGFNLGGTLALHMAVHHEELKAAAAFNADPNSYRMLLPTSEAAILAFYGSGPGGLAEADIADLRSRFDGSPGDHELIIYPGAGGDFFDETRPEFFPMAAEDSWARLLDFLETHLARPTHTLEGRGAVI